MIEMEVFQVAVEATGSRDIVSSASDNVLKETDNEHDLSSFHPDVQQFAVELDKQHDALIAKSLELYDELSFVTAFHGIQRDAEHPCDSQDINGFLQNISDMIDALTSHAATKIDSAPSALVTINAAVRCSRPPKPLCARPQKDRF